MQRLARSSFVAATIVATSLAITGCGLFIHSTPISRLPEQDREVMSQSGGTPDTVRLIRPATVSGFELAPGSVVQASGRDFRILTAQPLAVKDMILPPGSILELKHDTNIVTGDVYNWNGVVYLGGPFDYGMIQGQPGDRAYFEGRGFSSLRLMQLSIRAPREMGGRVLPAGSIIDLSEDGQIKESFTPDEQAVLARERHERQLEAERQERRCKEVCAPVTDFHEHAKCLGNCRS